MIGYTMSKLLTVNALGNINEKEDYFKAGVSAKSYPVVA